MHRLENHLTLAQSASLMSMPASQGLLVGSVAQRLREIAPCPVLVVRRPPPRQKPDRRQLRRSGPGPPPPDCRPGPVAGTICRPHVPPGAAAGSYGFRIGCLLQS